MCSGNAVLGGVSSTIDTDRSKTSVAPALRKSLMAITCVISWNEKTSLNDIKRKVALLDNFSDEI